MPLLGFPLAGLLGDDTIPTQAGLISLISDHVARAQARLLQQYKDKPGVGALIAALAGRAQVIENVLWGLLTQRSIATSVGAQLDGLGKLVGLSRASVPGGVSDAVYRKWIQAQVLLNRSNGTIPDLDAIFSFVCDVGTVIQVVEFAPASIVNRLSGVAQSQGPAIVAIAQVAKASGVGCTVDYLTATPAFGFDGAGAGFDTGYFGGSI